MDWWGESREGDGSGRRRNLAEVVEEALEEDGCRDDDSADGGHGPRRRLVQRPRAVPVAAHFLSALAAAALMASAVPPRRRERRVEAGESALNGVEVEQMRRLLGGAAACLRRTRCRCASILNRAAVQLSSNGKDQGAVVVGFPPTQEKKKEREPCSAAADFRV